jgi:hypothetical protein
MVWMGWLPLMVGEPLVSNLTQISAFSMMPRNRLLFPTTNHLGRLDPALCRRGRMDIFVEFTYATKIQAQELFEHFFVSEPQDNVLSSAQGAPNLCKDEVTDLAKHFADAIPEDEFSMSGCVCTFNNANNHDLPIS